MSLIVPASGRGNACSTSSVNLPRYAPMRSRSPSTRHTAGSPAPNSRAQLSRILSKTGFGSAIDPLITCRTSADAVCRSSASDVSLKRRAFCSATAACSDSPTRKSSSCGSNGLPPVRHTAIAPCTASPESERHHHHPLVALRRGARNLHGARVGLRVVDEFRLPALQQLPDDAFARDDRRGLDLVGRCSERDDRAVGATVRPGRKIALSLAVSRSFACVAMRSITVAEVERGGQVAADVGEQRGRSSRARRCVSSKRRAFSSATPMLAAIVDSRRTSASPNACSRSKFSSRMAPSTRSPTMIGTRRRRTAFVGAGHVLTPIGAAMSGAIAQHDGLACLQMHRSIAASGRRTGVVLRAAGRARST